VIDSSGITLKGNVKIKGSLAITSGAFSYSASYPDQVNKGQPLCKLCMEVEI